MKKTISSYEGKQAFIRDLKTPALETFTNIYKGKDYTIDFTIPEFTATCPKTGLPDFGTIHISYTPNAECIELKSLKEYILFFRNIGIFHENVVNKIYDDFKSAIKPKRLKVFGDFSVSRGTRTANLNPS
jgi:7-cyano-7-deazaguanine reductase